MACNEYNSWRYNFCCFLNGCVVSSKETEGGPTEMELQDFLTIMQRASPIQPQKLIDLAKKLRTEGDNELALVVYEFAPQILSSTKKGQMQLWATALQGQARTLDTLGRTSEADTKFAMSKHVATMSGQMR